MPGSNNFKLTLDTLAPNSCAITYPTSTVNVQSSITATFSNPTNLNPDTGNATYMKVWYDTKNATDTGTTVPSYYPTNSSGNGNTAVVWEPINTSKTFTFSSDGLYYVHAIFLDDVGNQTAIKTSALIRSDTLAPSFDPNWTSGGTETPDVYVYDKDSNSHDFVNNNDQPSAGRCTFGVHIYANDVGEVMSDLDYVVITQADLVGNDGDGRVKINSGSFNSSHIYTGDLVFKDGTTEGMKTFTVTAYDKSGNTKTTTTQIYYDPGISAATLTLKKDASTALPTWLRSANNSFIAQIATTDTDIVSYQLYGDLTGTGTTTSSTWKTFTKDSGKNYMTISGLSWDTSSDGLKTVYAKVKDSAGNIADCPVINTFGYDGTAPTATLTVSGAATGNWISNGSAVGTNGITAKNSCTVNYTYDAAVSGLASITFTCKNSSASTASTISGVSNGSFTFKDKDNGGTGAGTPGADAGSNVVTMTVTDNAGNVTTKTVTINIEDSFTVNGASLSGYELYSAFYRESTMANMVANLTMSTAPASGRSGVKVEAWIDQTSGTTTVPSDTTITAWGDSTTHQVTRNQIKSNPNQSNTNYVHIKVTDIVGNVVYKHLQFSYDTTAPTFTVSLPSNPLHTNNPSVVITIKDGTDTNLDSYQITSASNLAAGATSWTTWDGSSKNVTITLQTEGTGAEGNGDKTVTVTVRDKAGNTTAHSVTWEYDAKAPEGALVVWENDSDVDKASPSAEQKFRAHITYTPDSTDTTGSSGSIWYQISGDIATSATGSAIAYNAAAGDHWVKMTANSITTAANTYYLTQNPSGSAAEGVNKTITVHLKDDAGNITELTSVVKVLNQTPPVLTITEYTHNRISCEYVLRKDGSSTISDVANDYASLATFKVTSTQQIAEWKVAAYVGTLSGASSDATAANGGYPTSSTSGSSVTAIVKQTGSHSATDYSKTIASSWPTTWVIQVDGIDYQAALRSRKGISSPTAGDVDGIHYIVVFAKNRAGVWSVAGTAVSSNSGVTQKSVSELHP